MNDKVLVRIVAVITVLVALVVLVLNRGVLPRPAQMPDFVRYLPKLNACINATCSLLLLISFYFIKQKQIAIHKKINLTTFFLSAIFLVSYVTFHYFAEETKFPKDNPLRPLYLVILSSHIILAFTVLPLVLISFNWGLSMKAEKHRKIVRWSFPLWLYVTVTGVIVYLMISPYYKF